jgi:hypothetical protein
MSQPDPAERVRVTPSPDAEEHTGGMSMSPPPFQLYADGGSAAGGGDASTHHAAPPAAMVAQLSGEYAQFSEALHNVLEAALSFSGPGSAGDPATYQDLVPANCYAVLWDIHKALHWEESYGRTASDWARGAIRSMRDLQPELIANGVLGAPLLTQLTTTMAPILNPASGSAAASGLEGVFDATIENHRIMGPLSRTAQAKANAAESLRNVMVAAANILSDELSADVPGQILNADSPYNYLHYRALRNLSGGLLNGLTALYRGRWEVSRQGQRRDKMDYARNAFANVMTERNQRQIFENITSLDAAGITAQMAALRAGIQTHVYDRMDAIAGEAVTAPIARNGLAIPERARRTGGGGDGRRTAAPIEYAEGTVVTPWTPTTDTTAASAYAELGDEPHRTLHGANIGAFRSGGYPYVYGSREYKIVLRPTGRAFFGIKYGGRSGMTVNAVNDLLSRDYFTDIQRLVMRSALPQVSSEGGISSINTYDSQNITIAGRGEESRRASLLVEAATTLMAQYEPGEDVSQLVRVRTLIDELGATSEEGTAGLDGRRLDMVRIHELVELLENPIIHRAMTLAKINDCLVGFFDEDYRRGRQAARYDQDIDADRFTRVTREVDTNHLHPVIIGIALHHRLGRPAYQPMASSIEANNAYPQRAAYTAANQPDYAQLSKQLAYLTKLRIRSMLGRRDPVGFSISRDTLNAIFSQKVTDFNNYFESNGIAGENGTWFDYAAANTVMSFWTGSRQFVGSETRPAAGRLFFTQGSGGARRYFDCGPMTGIEEAAPEGGDTTQETEGEETTE